MPGLCWWCECLVVVSVGVGDVGPGSCVCMSSGSVVGRGVGENGVQGGVNGRWVGQRVGCCEGLDRVVVCVVVARVAGVCQGVKG